MQPDILELQTLGETGIFHSMKSKLEERPCSRVKGESEMN